MRPSLDIEPRPPTPGELGSAPLLRDWAIVSGGLGLRLTGNVSGHPKGPAAAPMTIITSTLLDIDPALVWARTENRFYRLGKPQDPAAYAVALAERWAIARVKWDASDAHPEASDDEGCEGMARGQGDAFTAHSGISDNEGWNWSEDMKVLGS